MKLLDPLSTQRLRRTSQIFYAYIPHLNSAEVMSKAIQLVRLDIAHATPTIMKPCTFLLAAFAGLVLAAPVSEADRDHEIIFYSDTDYRGRSDRVTVRQKTCTNLNRRLDDRVSSIRNEDKLRCHYYVDKDCGGRNFESSDSENDLKRRFDDSLSSFQCEWRDDDRGRDRDRDHDRDRDRDHDHDRDRRPPRL
ncbi:hypothetical protein GQ53DRAFT_847677 [Thozetella sp. PMI_491]|nr:hypothetical protein GQ53DRAFT_847677 [Thozetella sp. PMI_491]